MVQNAKIPLGLSREHLQEKMREIFQYPDFVLSDEDYQSYLTPRENKAEILKIISPFYDELEKDSSKNSKKKKGELLDVARYLHHNNLHNDHTILESCEMPDFVLSGMNERIGVEVCRLWNTVTTPNTNILKKLLNQAAELIRKSTPKFTGTFNLQINPDKPFIDNKLINQLSKKEKLDVATQISNFVLSYIPSLKPINHSFIENASYIANEVLDICLSEKYSSPSLTYEQLISLVTMKEQKISNYKLNKELDKVWLLIAYNPGSGPTDFKVPKELAQASIISTFDKVILCDVFRGHTLVW